MITRLVFLFIPFFLFSANPKISDERTVPAHWVKSLTDYREELMLGNAEATLQLRNLVEKWFAAGLSADVQAQFTLNVLTYVETNDKSVEELLQYIEIYGDSQGIHWEFTKDDAHTIIESGQLLSLIHFGLLEPAYPFKLNRKTTVFKQMEFLGIDNHQSIGEVGVGLGAYSLMISQIAPDNRLLLNEVNESALEYIRKLILEQEHLYNSENIELIPGSSTKTNFEPNSLDKVIVRKTYHHFKSKGKMLRSIKQSLKPGGELYIFERLRDLNDGHRGTCGKELWKKEIVERVSKSGFRLESELELNKSAFFKFVMKDS